MNPKAYRLPTDILPRRYDIQIDARLGREDFHGKVSIKLDIEQARDTIELHARDLKLADACLTCDGAILSGVITQDAEREMAEIRFDRPLPTGEAYLDISFDGQVSTNLEGLYLAKDGPEQCLCTQCEETDARAIFPCWDEPTFKAQFAWEITTAADATVLANGPLISTTQSEDGGSKTWLFEPTEPMSSYLVALVIGAIASTEEEDVSGTPVKVWALKGKEQMGRFAHGFTARLLPWYEDYFATPYHFDKYDQVAVPGFAAGAMENAGLVLFRQSALLMNPQTASWQAEKRIAHVVAHEFAHMWFGDLVTMKWWDDLWLNEAFAEWMAHKVVSALQPDYESWADFQASKLGALGADALESTHPIYNKVETPAEAAEMFDSITYDKGCSVMRMLENFLGEEHFRAGIRTYMREFAEGNATGADLWRHLQQASDHPVTEIMESWITQGGYPLVSVAMEQRGRDIILKLSQKRFFSDPQAKDNGNQLWQVPVVIRYENESGSYETRYLLSKAEDEVTLDVTGDLKWCYANAGEIGFYRQSLSSALLKSLLTNLNKLSPVEQMGVLGDQWALVRNGANSMTQFLDVLAALCGTDNYSVLESVVGRLYAIESLLEDAGDENALNKFRNWVDNTFKSQLGALGFEPKEDESQNDAQRRVSLISAMTVLAHNEDAVKHSVEWAEREAGNPASVNPNLGGLFVDIAAHFGDRARFDKYVQIYQQRKASSSSPQETNRYLNSFADFQQPDLVQSALDLIDRKVVPQEAIGPMLRQMLPQRHAQLAAWNYMKEHWPTIRNLGDMWTGFLVEASGQLPASERGDIVSFYDANLNGVAQKSYARALETLDQLAEFKARTKGDLMGWFGK